MFQRRVAGIVATAALIFAACGGGGATTAPSAAATSAPSAAATAAATTAAAPCKVGVSFNNYQEPRWAKFDEPAIKAAVTAGGGTYDSNDAKSSAATQTTNVENLISGGATVLIILAQDGTAIKSSTAAAAAAGIPVIAYDRLIEDPSTLYITFDNVEVGRLEAEAVLKAVPSGKYIIIKGNKADANADFLRDGYVKAGVPPVGTTGAVNGIEIVGETYTDNWTPSLAQTEVEQFLTANANKVDAVLSENDGMAGGAIAALTAQGLNGKVAVSGQDGDAANLTLVAKGDQTIDVWKDARALGKAAGEAAVALCKDKDVSKVSGAAPFTTPGKNTISSILLKPTAITKDNLNVVIDAGWITKETLCQGVPAGKAPACG